MKTTINTAFYNQIIDLLQAARNSVVLAVNQTMVLTYFKIGERIVKEEQNGKDRAEYGKSLLLGLSNVLTKEFGKGFSVTNIQQMRNFYLAYEKQQTLSVKSKKAIKQTVSVIFNLSWSHYLILVRIENEDERKFYEIEASKNNWSVRELDRQVNSSLYERLCISKEKEEIVKLSKNGQIIEKAFDLIKDPYVLEFLNLEEKTSYNETDLEQALINKLEHFLLELGKGFTFVGRQVRFTFDEEHFRVDLVFYNRLLKCFVLIDLKIGKLKHQDLGQMQMYVNYYDRFVKLEEENKTIGIVLCKDKKDTMVEITLPENNEQIFASKYELILPSKKELQKLIESKNN
jgi:predicted nuclease of restriction endonuclease-like (RecB) superfamily